MIRELPLEVRSKIAAGEVIERPVSVVKELVENALDAGATDIKVSVINGGLDEIMVSDNGCGMPFEELPLAVKRFTTSKIGSVEDLDSIATLGFRGEALASIADVADLTIFSCDGETSGQLRIRGGELLLCKPVASPKGTRVIVRDLFFNLPARKKFLRSASTEFSHIQKFLQSMVLIYPNVQWTFTSEKGVIWHVPPQLSAEERFYSLFGQKAQFRAFTASQGELDIYLNPNIVGELILSVNGRLIKGSAYFQVLRILKDMWGGANLPVMVLRLNVEPDQVDVNVHPQKLDIRFKSQVWLRQALQELITQVRGEAGGLGIDFKTNGGMPHYQSEAWTTTPNDAPTVISEAMRENYMLFQKEALQNQKDVGSVVSKGFEIKDYLYDTYILIKRDGVYELWDQHAVNEKINYWRLSSLYGVQFLLEPLFCGVDEETAQALTEMGFELQQVRGGYLIKAVPSLLLLSRSLDVIIDDLESIKGNIEKTRADLACKSAVKAGQKLSPMEIEALVVEGLKVLDVSYDPHGRPAVVKLDEALIERLFNR